jgi:hypothetical protein
LHEPWTGDDWYPEVPNTGDLADEAFREALNGWDNDQRAQQLKEAIETIENPGAIKKIVCIGLGRLILPSANNDKPEVCAVSLAQHTAAIKIAEQLKQLTGQDSRIYAVDPGYHAEHKRALEKRNITILDNSYEKQEHFPEIDDSTIVIAIPGLSITYLKDLILEYARPAVLIIERSKVHDFPPWKSFQPDVTEDDTRVARAKDFQWWEMFKSPRTSEGFGIRETIAVPGKP